MYSDKQKAKKNKWRTSERTFFIIALLGGSLGVLLGMQWFRHKTKHLSFKLIIPIISMIQIALVYYLKLWP
ncbi:MAG: DUF1294 domain-containing protein [Bacillaceae bacterium]|nr:DUF1294 domain-containing protein [Bacillaceae bacterium]